MTLPSYQKCKVYTNHLEMYQTNFGYPYFYETVVTENTYLYLFDSNMRPNRRKVQPVQTAKSTRQQNIFTVNNI